MLSQQERPSAEQYEQALTDYFRDLTIQTEQEAWDKNATNTTLSMLHSK